MAMTAAAATTGAEPWSWVTSTRANGVARPPTAIDSHRPAGVTRRASINAAASAPTIVTAPAARITGWVTWRRR